MSGKFFAPTAQNKNKRSSHQVCLNPGLGRSVLIPSSPFLLQVFLKCFIYPTCFTNQNQGQLILCAIQFWKSTTSYSFGSEIFINKLVSILDTDTPGLFTLNAQGSSELSILSLLELHSALRAGWKWYLLPGIHLARHHSYCDHSAHARPTLHDLFQSFLAEDAVPSVSQLSQLQTKS